MVSHYYACCLPVLRSAGWETISPKLLMCVVSRHKAGVYVSTLVPQNSCHLGMFIIATLQVGKLKFTGADPGPKASLSDSGDWIHSPLSLCLSFLCSSIVSVLVESQSLSVSGFKAQESVGLTCTTVGIRFLSLNKRANTHLWQCTLKTCIHVHV